MAGEFEIIARYFTRPARRQALGVSANTDADAELKPVAKR